MYSTRPVRRGSLDSPLPEDLVGSDLHWAYREALYRFRHRPEVTGISLGNKIQDQQPLETTAVRIHVREKYPKAVLSKREILPEDIVGIPVDVLPRVYLAESCSDAEQKLIGRRVNPVQPGFNIGPLGPPSGTFGMVIFQGSNGLPGLLSAAHVLVTPDAQDQDPIVQPYFGSEANDTIARLTGPRLFGEEGDAAYALFTGNRQVNPNLRGSTPTLVQGVRMPTPGEILWKSGYKTCVTMGRVESCCSFIEVEYQNPKQTLHMKGFEIRPLSEDEADNPISKKGDSGAIWVGEDGFGVGLHVGGQQVAGGEAKCALACFLPTVLEELDLTAEPPAGTTLPTYFTENEPAEAPGIP
jgi:hypothetical protein